MTEPVTQTTAEESKVLLWKSDIGVMKERLAALNAECNQRHAEIRLLERKIKAAEYLAQCQEQGDG